MLTVVSTISGVICSWRSAVGNRRGEIHHDFGESQCDTPPHGWEQQNNNSASLLFYKTRKEYWQEASRQEVPPEVVAFDKYVKSVYLKVSILDTKRLFKHLLKVKSVL